MEKNRLRWATRRGMLELDLVLSPFLENHYDHITEEEQALFHDLLEEQDQDMFNWFIHRHVPEDTKIKRIVDLVRSKNSTAG